MLADELLAIGPEDEFSQMVGDGFAAYQGVLAGAQKFVLDRSIGEVAGDMSRPAVREVLPFCRLPYPRCWIEIAQQDRPFFAEAFNRGPNHSGGRTYQPVRVGILCEQMGDNAQRFWATLAWTYTAADAKAQSLQSPVSICPMGVSIKCDEADVELEEPFHLDVMIAPYWRSAMLLIADKLPGLLPMLARNADHDWAGEPWFWLGVLALLNAKNGARAEFRPAPEKLNRSRAKIGKPPLVDYHQLTLNVGLRDTRGRSRGGGQDHDAMRAHVVRGHFKVRKTGIYWWRPFVRGDVREGFAAKSYAVKTAGEAFDILRNTKP